MLLLSVNTYGIYLPNSPPTAVGGYAPFGSPLACSATHASPAVFTAKGYLPTNGDIVALSTYGGGSGALPGGFSAFDPFGSIGITQGDAGAMNQYYVVDASNDTFELAATSGGSAIDSTSTGTDVLLIIITAAGTNGNALGTTQPFKSGDNVLVYNTTDATLSLSGAVDSNTSFGYPEGAGSYTTIVSVPAYSFGFASLAGYDWIKGSGAGLQLIMN